MPTTRKFKGKRVKLQGCRYILFFLCVKHQYVMTEWDYVRDNFYELTYTTEVENLEGDRFTFRYHKHLQTPEGKSNDHCAEVFEKFLLDPESSEYRLQV